MSPTQLQQRSRRRKHRFPAILTALTLGLIAFSGLILLTQENDTITPITNDIAIDTTANPELAEVAAATGTYEGYLAQGDAYFNSRSYNKALESYIRAYQLNQDEIIPFLRIIDVYLLVENYDIAFENIRLTEAKDPDNVNLALAKIRYTLAQEDYTEARLLADQTPNKTERIILYQAIVEIMNGRYDDAQGIINQLLETAQNPQVRQTAEQIQKAYALFSTFEEGQVTYLEALLGQALNQIREYKLAREMFYRSIDKANDFRDSWVGLGYAFLQIKNYNQAEQALEKAKQLDPYKPETYLYLGITAAEQNEHERALGFLSQAQQYEYDNPIEVSEHLASNFYALERYSEAIPHYANAINNKRVPLDYYIAPIWISLEQTKNFTLAEQFAQKAREFYPNAAESYNYLGWVKLYQRDFSAARDNLTQAISINPKLPSAYLNFGLLFKEQAEYKTAEPFFRKAIELAEIANNESIAIRANDELKVINTIIKQLEINTNNNSSIQ